MKKNLIKNIFIIILWVVKKKNVIKNIFIIILWVVYLKCLL